ncbi:pentatricopeptide repeat-containing protein At1g69290 [Silene latifolia]|uniref:pentatricopeptide repeat-containing protein At1g69290 n=1 Tax=Silene latifolia TaxID=37657 RepID=UPI003D76D47F
MRRIVNRITLLRQPPIAARKPFTSSTSNPPPPPQNPSLYSFLEPSLFSLNKPSLQQSPPSKSPNSQITLLSQNDKNALVTSLELALSSSNTDEAWKCFKTLVNCNDVNCLPSKNLSNLVIKHLVSINDVHNLKRAFASIVYLIEKDSNFVEFGTVRKVLEGMCHVGSVAPAFALMKCLFKNRVFVGFDVWGDVIVEVSKKGGCFLGYLGLFHESCRVAIDEKLEFMKPDLNACNAALEGCCFELESVKEAERVIELMSGFGVRPDKASFGFLGYLYALKGLEGKVVELEGLMGGLGLGLEDKSGFLSNLIRGYVKAGSLESVSKIILRSLRDGDGEGVKFSSETYCEVVNGFLKHETVRDLSALVVEAQLLESESVVVEESVGFGVVNACVELRMLDKAHSIMDEMTARGAVIGLGVYLSILRAYCKEQRTAEAAQLVAQIKNSGFELDTNCYDSLIEASMSSQDFQSAFSMFRDMRDARISELKGSYITIMTGLTENNRPELMAAFLDEVVEDPRIEVGTHDWNSIIHAFCKAGRMDDAQRTFRRMVFLHYEPNEQTYLSLINGYVSAVKYFNVLLLWNDVKKHMAASYSKGFKLNHSLTDAILYALVKGGFFDAVMEVVDISQGMKIFVDKWRYKQAFMETHKKLKIAKLRRKNVRKMEALIAFKNWAGLNV